MSARTMAMMAVCLLAGVLAGGEAFAQTTVPVKARNVVLVHGAWADGSSWGEVIPRLQAAGLNVTAVQNPLSSLAESARGDRSSFDDHRDCDFQRLGRARKQANVIVRE